ncbi:hypothetical protein BMS3Bbin01_01791 [bacterium BMS3Bbin01]|nr:hypothetical protein BMS3Bbin01_01791 [bacterium BMS3Bbin01]
MKGMNAVRLLTWLLLFTVWLTGGCAREGRSAASFVQRDNWATIYTSDYSSERIHAFEFDPAKIKDWEIYPDHPCVKATIDDGTLITTTIARQNCWIEGLNENLLTNWSDVATPTHEEAYIFPHPKIRMTARFMFPSKDMDEEYFFHMNPEIFTDKANGNYNLFAQIRVSNKGNVIYVGENDREMLLGTITIEPDRWHDVVLEVDMETRRYTRVSVDNEEWNSDEFRSNFTVRKDNGMGEFRSMMGFWIGSNLPWGSNAAGGRDLYVDRLTVEIAR